MEKYVLWIVTVGPISCLFLFLLLWIIKLKIVRDKSLTEEEIVFLLEKETSKNQTKKDRDLEKEDRGRVASVGTQENIEKGNYLPQFSVGQFENEERESNDIIEWVTPTYRILLRFDILEPENWSLEIVKVIFLIPHKLEVQNMKKYFITLVVVGQDFEGVKKLKTETKKYQEEILFGNRISVLKSLKDVVVELQLFSIDRYARHRVRSEIVIDIDRIVKIHRSFEQENVVIDVGNIEREAAAMNRNEDTPKNLFLSFTTIYSDSTGLLSIFVDHANPNLVAISRRFSEILLLLSIENDGIVLDNQAAEFVEMGSPNTFSNEKATVFCIEKKYLATAQIILQVHVKTSLCSFRKTITVYLFSQDDGSQSIFQCSLADVASLNSILYSRNVVSSQLEEAKEAINKDYLDY